MGHTASSSGYARILLALLATGMACTAANAAITVLGTQYQQDILFPEYNCIYNNANYPTSCPSVTPGSNIHVYLKNTGASSVTVQDVTFAGYSLETVIKEKWLGQNDAYSIYFYWDEPPSDIINAGEPVWYRSDPDTIPAGGTAQVVIRLRYVPTTPTVSVGVVHTEGTTSATVVVNPNVPRIASIGFSKNRDSAYIHWRKSGGAAPTTIKVDGVDVTAYCTTVSDSSVDFAVTKYTPSSALGNMSYHVYQGIYSDGSVASTSIRTYVNRFDYGTYGAEATTTWEDAKNWIDKCQDRGVNLLIWNNGSDGLVSFLDKSQGQEYAADRGYDFMVDYPHKWNCDIPRLWYMRDEPDAHDWHLGCGLNLLLPCPVESHNVGALATAEDRIYAGYRTNYPTVPTSINIDATFMPYNYYTYGQLVDVGMSDPYYQSRQAAAYWSSTKDIPLYEQATYIYAVSRCMTAACEPNPTLIALMCSGDVEEADGWWPFPDPGTKRTEAYYSLAGGAKSMGYWWFLGEHGLGVYNEAALACWKEMGLLGNEFRAAQPVIVLSQPADMTISATTDVWAKALPSGIDSIMLVAINEDLVNDINGCHYNPISNAEVTVTVPSWMTSCSAFEINSEGVSSISTSRNGSQITVSLGTLELTKLVVLTTNPTLRQTIAQRYLEKCHRGICNFASEHCTSQATGIQNAGAENGFNQVSGGYIADGWIEWESTFGTIVGYDETTTKRSGGHSQRIRVWNTGGTSGGVLQKVPATANSAFSVSTYIYAGDSNTSCYLGVDPAGGTNATSGNVTWSSATTSQSWVQKTVAGTATSNFITVFYKVACIDSNKHNGYFDDATPTCSGPSITTNPSNQNICPGGNASFSVAASAGSGTVSYQWQKDQLPVVNGGHYSGATTATLSITGADGVDAGSYRCVVTTTYGTATSNSASLTFTSAITQQPVSSYVCPTGTVSFSVGATGATAYQWQKNSVNLSNGGHYAGCTTATLTVSSADTNDVANYRCIVTGSCGTHTSNQASLTLYGGGALTNGNFEYSTVANPPYGWTTYIQPTKSGLWTIQTSTPPEGARWQQTQVYNANSYGGIRQNITGLTSGAVYTITGTYKCNSGTATASVRYNLNGNTDRAYSSVLVSRTSTSWGTFIGSVTATGGTITLFLDHLNGTSTNKASGFDNIKVSYLPGIIEQPQAMSTCPGSTAWFVVAVAGNGSLSYQWQKNSANISDGGHYSGCNSSMLTISNADTNDVANYRCIVTADCGSATSNQAALSLSTGVSITQQPSAQSTCPGANASFSLAASGSGSLIYQWQKDGVYLANGGHYSGVTTATLTITGADTNDIANYRCWVSGDCGSAVSNAVGLSLKAITAITQDPTAQNVCPGGNAQFTAAGTGDGTLTYQWQKNSVNLSNGGHYAGCTTATLTVSSADTNDVASYRCVISGTCGSATTYAAALTLKAATTITGQPIAQNVCTGDYAEFAISATGQGTLAYQWQKDGANLSNGGHYAGCTTATLSITGADATDVAGYRCIATAECGSATSNSASLSLKAGTAVTGHPSAQNICAGGNAQFSASGTGAGTLTYQWQKNQANLSNGGHYSGVTTATLTITGADAYDAANYRCIITADCGSAASNEAALTLKADTAITTDPTPTSTCPGSSAQFTVGATGEGTLSYQWQLNGANLSNGGHYAGCTTATLTVSNADINDEGDYRCVVTGECGSDISNVASLTLYGAGVLTNGNFEYSTVGNPPYGWTTYIQSTKSGSWTIQTVSPPEGASWQQTQVYNISSFGGIRQNVTGLTGGVVYTISGTYRTNSTSATASIRYNLAGNTDRAYSTVLVSKTDTNWGTFSSTVTASGSSLALFLDHLNGTSSNKASAFDNIKVTCTP